MERAADEGTRPLPPNESPQPSPSDETTWSSQPTGSTPIEETTWRHQVNVELGENNLDTPQCASKQAVSLNNAVEADAQTRELADAVIDKMAASGSVSDGTGRETASPPDEDQLVVLFKQLLARLTATTIPATISKEAAEISPPNAAAPVTTLTEMSAPATESLPLSMTEEPEGAYFWKAPTIPWLGGPNRGTPRAPTTRQIEPSRQGGTCHGQLPQLRAFFDGSPRADAATFLLRCEEHFGTAALDQEEWTPLAASHLRGEAQQWWASLSNQPSSWRVFGHRLVREFNSLGRRIRLAEELQLQRQRRGEDALQFLEDKRAIAAKIFPDASPYDLARRCHALLREPTRMRVERLPWSNLDQLMDAVEQLEAWEEEDTQFRQIPTQPQFTRFAAPPEIIQERRLQTASGPSHRDQEPPNRTRSPTPNTRRWPERRPPQGEYSRGGRSPPYCWKCGGEHLHRNCPQRARPRPDNS